MERIRMVAVGLGAPIALALAMLPGVVDAFADDIPVPVAGSPATVVVRPTGKYLVAPGRDEVPGLGRVIRYEVQVEGGLPVQPADFAADVARILNDPLGWGHGGTTIRFQRVDHGHVDLRVSLSSPRMTDRQCAPLRTNGKVSCYNGRHRAVINADRWLKGSPTYGQDLADYRSYLISHEVGHSLGHHHVHCTHRGAPAPVMVQQTKSLEGCKPNWLPYAGGEDTAKG